MRELHLPRGTASARILLALGRRHGLSSAECLLGTNASQAQIDDPVGEITVAQELRLVRNLTAALPNRPALGLEAGSHYHIDQFGILGFLHERAATAGHHRHLAALPGPHVHPRPSRDRS